MAKKPRVPGEVFLNIPYDKKFERLFVAYIAGITAFGLMPRATLEIRSSSRRLEKILRLIADCRFSIHDLSRVELDVRPPRTPRFNMPFELGLAVGSYWKAMGKQNWFVCEAKGYRLSKSLSDLNGTDPYIHDGKIAGVFRELCNIFTRSGGQPTVQQMNLIYRELRRNLPAILRRSGSLSLYTTTVFKELAVAAKICAENIML
ncbi:MAG TPA: hypothetical protein VMJ93_02345 [Verrucomicrobiae bacterium]|nr:hypothetical protein [Verrucomicrobiae bacterium]HUN63787.1 hypothetical protein [Candidatus Sulfotelmatobacter sp.]